MGAGFRDYRSLAGLRTVTAPRAKRTRLRKAAQSKQPRLSGEALAEIQDRVGHVFKDRALIDLAVTHPSALASLQGTEKSNQRLEFLGDRVLGLVIAERLYERRPGDREGALAPRLNHLVNKRACAEAAIHKGLGDFLILGESERRNGGATKENILGDMCEAVIGALYLDGGLKVARKFIESAWAPQFGAPAGDVRDAKSLLQEWAQARQFPLPSYKLISREGPDHAPEFTVEVAVGDKHRASGSGNSKQDAERAAAMALMARVD